MTPRLNLNLRVDDQQALEQLREKLEKSYGKRLSLAEVVRRAIHIAYNNQISHQDWV